MKPDFLSISLQLWREPSWRLGQGRVGGTEVPGCTESHSHLHDGGSRDGKFLTLMTRRIRLCPWIHLGPNCSSPD